MDQNQSEDQVLREHFKDKQFLKRAALQFVLSVSLFCVFVWYSSGFSIHPKSFNAYFSACLFSIFTHTLERKYMFIICNGILALVAKTSLLNSSDCDSSHHHLQPSSLSETKPMVSGMVVVPLVVEKQKGQEEYNGEVSEADHEDQEEAIMCIKTDGGESEAHITEEEEIIEEDEEGETQNGVEVELDDELEAETAIITNEDLVNTEELNRKFEEFIRKMKEEMRIAV